MPYTSWQSSRGTWEIMHCDSYSTAHAKPDMQSMWALKHYPYNASHTASIWLAAACSLHPLAFDVLQLDPIVGYGCCCDRHDTRCTVE